MTNLRTIFHRDGTITYYSVYQQVWRRHLSSISDGDLAAISGSEHDRIERHLHREEDGMQPQS